MIDAIHNYGKQLDPVLIARPAWWRATIWIDVLFFGPFYVAAIYAFVKGKNWIKIPMLVYSGMMISNVLIILFEEAFGTYPAPQFLVVLAFNLPWLLMPLYIIYRATRGSQLFEQIQP